MRDLQVGYLNHGCGKPHPRQLAMKHPGSDMSKDFPKIPVFSGNVILSFPNVLYFSGCGPNETSKSGVKILSVKPVPWHTAHDVCGFKPLFQMIHVRTRPMKESAPPANGSNSSTALPSRIAYQTSPQSSNHLFAKGFWYSRGVLKPLFCLDA